MLNIFKISKLLLLFATLAVLMGCNQRYTVTFDSNGGTAIDSVTVNKGDLVSEPTYPTKEGYTFDGWYKDDNLWDFENKVYSDLTLISKWSLNTYTITIDTDGGMPIEPLSFKYGEEISIETPKKDGFEFVGWDEDVPSTMPACNLSLKAIWKEAFISIGSIGPLSGSTSIYGLAVKKGIELAIEEINNDGGILVGETYKKFKLDFINDEATSDKAATALTTLVDKKADIIVGAVTSGCTEGLIREAVKVGIPVITPTGTADRLTVGQDGNQRSSRQNIFRACFNDSYQGKYMANYAKKAGYEKVYVLFNKDDYYSVGLKDAFVETAEANGMTVVAQGYGRDVTDFRSFWAPVLSGEYQCVYVPDYYETAYYVLKTGYAEGYTGVCYGGDGWDGVIQQVKYGHDISFLENCFYTSHYFGASESENVKKFVAAYKAKYNGETPFSFAALGYDAVYMAKQAIEQAGSTDYEEVIKALTYGTFGGFVTSDKEFKFNNGNPEKDLFIITFKNGKEIEAK